MEHQTYIVTPWKLLADIFIIACFGVPILVLFLTDTAYHRGFYCDDESLRHPYKDSTVPSYYLYIFGFGVNIFAIIICEYFQRSRKGNQKVMFFGKEIPAWIWHAYMAFIIFCFGAGCSQLTTDALKYTIGRLRPHFYTLCKPTFNGQTCDSKNIPLHQYIIDFDCTNPEVLKNDRKMKEMRLSFPSGHSSFSMYTALFFAIYLQAKVHPRDFKLIKHFVQALAILAALWTGMTRISDYKHHWSDVLSGLTLGALVAIVVTRYVSPLFQPREKVMANGSLELGTVNSNKESA